MHISDWSSDVCSSDLDTGFYSLKMKRIKGNEVDFSQFKGKKVLIVNTASECGFTPQYEGLEELYRTYGKKGLVILGFPANNFGGQEPGSNLEIDRKNVVSGKGV